MNTKDTAINDTNFRKLVNNDDYYRHIFKKTEKIISVVFYILNNTDAGKKSETHISNIAGKAHFAHENALRTLEVKLANSREVLEQFAQALIALDSTLRIATAGSILTEDVLYVVTGEIDAVLRSLSPYISNEVTMSAMLSTQVSQASSRQHGATSPGTTSIRKSTQKVSSSHVQASASPDRRTRIQTIIEAKGEATIKDISEIVTDCSEKTVQRELNAMIEGNLIKRHGERRWSKYSLG
ncbi:MAG: hypothetical protein ACI92I_000816 [Acidimicrobiales bacterium]|jgi:hypothetical protein